VRLQRTIIWASQHLSNPCFADRAPVYSMTYSMMQPALRREESEKEGATTISGIVIFLCCKASEKPSTKGGRQTQMQLAWWYVWYMFKVGDCFLW